MKYHFNSETGKTGVCYAKIKCRLGIPLDEHYGSQVEAQEAYEVFMSEETLTSVKKVDENPVESEINPWKRFDYLEEEIKKRRKKLKKFQTDYENHKPVTFTEFVPVDSENVKKLKESYENLQPLLTEGEIEAVRQYTGITYGPINEYLRSKHPESHIFHKDEKINIKVKERIINIIGEVDSYLSKAEKRQKTVFRSLAQDFDDSESIVNSEQWASDLGFSEGKTVTFAGFSSTTIDPSYIVMKSGGEYEHTNIAFVITTNHGAAVGEIKEDKNHHSFVQDKEYEVLLPRDSQYIVQKVERAKFLDDDGDSVEPLTVYLQEAVSNN